MIQHPTSATGQDGRYGGDLLLGLEATGRGRRAGRSGRTGRTACGCGAGADLCEVGTQQADGTVMAESGDHVPD